MQEKKWNIFGKYESRIQSLSIFVLSSGTLAEYLATQGEKQLVHRLQIKIFTTTLWSFLFKL